ncbi:hypothetical protein CDL15_Pgr026154 [Punica granatum]|uniref:Uncharacterized protein n=1 Tax=Punica granatum TaxID=22663 RepID=A0A218WX18_PUNGR|nr:hypothetical protein CDL15_Pgr026154 [Punica granatum]
MPPEGMAESPIVPHGHSGSSFTPRFVDPYSSPSLAVTVIYMHDGKTRDLGVRDPKGSRMC